MALKLILLLIHYFVVTECNTVGSLFKLDESGMVLGKIQLLKELYITPIHKCLLSCDRLDLCVAITYNKISGFCQIIEKATVLETSQKVKRLDTEVHLRFVENPCKNNADFLLGYCYCRPCWAGKLCDDLPTDCTDAYNAMAKQNRSNDYVQCEIKPIGVNSSFDVPCRLNHGGQAVLQFDDSRKCIAGANQILFHKKWSFFKDGFREGDCFWMGLEKLHAITNQPGKRGYLIVQIVAQTQKKQLKAYYDFFAVGSESEGYALKLDAYRPSSDAADAMTGVPNQSINGMKFSTFDKDQDLSPDNCAQQCFAGWWYADSCCSVASVNGRKLAPSTSNTVSPYHSLWEFKDAQRNLYVTELLVGVETIIK